MVDSATQKPLLGVLVVAVPNDLQALTSNDGRFVLGPLSAGQYELRLELHGFSSRAFDVAIDSSLFQTHDLGHIQPIPAETLQVDIVGVVRDSATNTPVVGVVISVNGAVSGVSLLDGYFSATIALPVGPNTIDVRVSWRSSSRWTVHSGMPIAESSPRNANTCRTRMWRKLVAGLICVRFGKRISSQTPKRCIKWCPNPTSFGRWSDCYYVTHLVTQLVHVIKGRPSNLLPRRPLEYRDGGI